MQVQGVLISVLGSGRRCAVPIGHVAEVMRPLRIEPLARLPSYALGVSIIRGAPTPVLDLGLLLGAGPAQATRFITLRVGARTVALAVDAVVGVRHLSADALATLPPMLGGAGDEVIANLGTLDAELLVVLRAGHLLPEAAWSALEVQQ